MNHIVCEKWKIHQPHTNFHKNLRLSRLVLLFSCIVLDANASERDILDAKRWFMPPTLLRTHAKSHFLRESSRTQFWFWFAELILLSWDFKKNLRISLFTRAERNIHINNKNNITFPRPGTRAWCSHGFWIFILFFSDMLFCHCRKIELSDSVLWV